MRMMLSRVAGLFRRSRRDAALDDEGQAHLDPLAVDYERRLRRRATGASGLWQ